MAVTQPVAMPDQNDSTLCSISQQAGSPPCLSYSPSSSDTPSSMASSPPATLRTASSSLASSPVSRTRPVLRQQPSFVRRKPVPRLTLEEELALLDDEARRHADGAPAPTPIPGFALLPALELLAKKQVEASPRPLCSVVPDPPCAVMLPKQSELRKSVPIPQIIATCATKIPEEADEPLSPIPPESPSVSEVAIEWYITPVADTTNSKRFRIPSDAASVCGCPALKCSTPTSRRSSNSASDGSTCGYQTVEELASQQSDYDSDEMDDEKRVSIMTDTFGPPGHIRECKTGPCSLTSVALNSEGGDSEDDQNDESRDYVSAIPIPVLSKEYPESQHDDGEDDDVLGESFRLSEYRWLPRRFGDHQEGRKHTPQSFSTTTTYRFPRSRSPTCELDDQSFVTAEEVPSTPSMYDESGVFRTPRGSNDTRLPRPFLNTSPSASSFDSESAYSNAATVTTSAASNENDSIFDTPSRRANLPSRGSLHSISSDPAGGIGINPRSTLPGRKISLSASPGSYSAATMRWDRGIAANNRPIQPRVVQPIVRRPYSAENPSFVNVFPPPPADYQSEGRRTPNHKSQKQRRNLGGSPASGADGRGTPRGQHRAKVFSLVMRELLALHEASIKARHEAARAKAEKKAAVRQALKLYTYQKPTEEALKDAADCVVYAATGKEVRFGDLYQGTRTIVCFIRHYWCPSCQDYLTSIMRVEPAELRALNLQLIIIGCGNWKMIDGYRKALNGCEFPIYSDPSREVYQHFGITLSSMAAGTKPAYTKHGVAVNTLISLKRNTAMPLKNPGDLNGLGGEFVVGPGETECVYAHRMKTTRDHAELVDILKAIGTSPPQQLHVKPEVVRRARSAEEIREDQVQKRAESVRRKRMRALKPGRVVVTVVDNPHLKESSVQTV